jgi:selenocysteine lyase/cysteine desulfurase
LEDFQWLSSDRNAGFQQIVFNETQMWQLALLLANADKLPDFGKSGAGRTHRGEYRSDNRAARVARTARAAVSEFRTAKISGLENRENSFSSNEASEH